MKLHPSLQSRALGIAGCVTILAAVSPAAQACDPGALDCHESPAVPTGHIVCASENPSSFASPPVARFEIARQANGKYRVHYDGAGWNGVHDLPIPVEFDYCFSPIANPFAAHCDDAIGNFFNLDVQTSFRYVYRPIMHDREGKNAWPAQSYYFESPQLLIGGGGPAMNALFPYPKRFEAKSFFTRDCQILGH